MTFRSAIIPVAAAALACLAGCPKSGQEAPAAKAAPPPEPVAAESAEGIGMPTPDDTLGRLFSEVENLYFGGATNEALKKLSDALENPEYGRDRHQIFGALVRTELGAGLADSVRARLLDACVRAPDMAEDACGALYYHYQETGDLPAAIAWTEEVLALPDLPSSIRRNMREWNFLSVVAAGDDDKAVSLAAGLIADAPAGEALRILQRGAEALFERKRLDAVSRILDNAGRKITSDAATRNLLAALRLRLQAEQGDWDAYGNGFAAATATFSDAELLHVMRRTVPLAVKARQYAVADAVCLGVVTNAVFRQMAHDFAARQWVGVAEKSDLSDIPARLDFLIGRGKQLGEVCALFLRHAYDGVDDPAFAAEMRPVGERLVPLAGDDDARNSVRTAILDYCFVLEDYDAALLLLKAGFAGYDRNWHDMAVSKIQAHKALKEKRPLDAIREFRAFMAVVQASEETETSDPSTGAIHTREMILGRNARRIGDIYASVPDAEKAAAAYEEARAYYQKALGSSTDPEVLDLVKKEMAQVPAKK